MIEWRREGRIEGSRVHLEVLDGPLQIELLSAQLSVCLEDITSPVYTHADRTGDVDRTHITIRIVSGRVSSILPTASLMIGLNAAHDGCSRCP